MLRIKKKLSDKSGKDTRRAEMKLSSHGKNMNEYFYICINICIYIYIFTFLILFIYFVYFFIYLWILQRSSKLGNRFNSQCFYFLIILICFICLNVLKFTITFIIFMILLCSQSPATASSLSCWSHELWRDFNRMCLTCEELFWHPIVHHFCWDWCGDGLGGMGQCSLAAKTSREHGAVW